MPIQTTNLISTPNIEGNIGQCQTTTSVINCTTRLNLFTCIDTGYATNSCTGKVDIYQTWSPSGISWIGVIIAGIILVVMGFNLMAKIFDW